MHYRSGLNMIPLIEWYRAHPNDTFLLEIAMGAITGQMTNIDANGATSMMFHAMPYVMDFDPHSGDYGLGFFGNALESASYYVASADLGDLCYLCDLDGPAADGTVTLTPRDAYRIAVFLEPLGLYLQALSGTISEVTFAPSKRRIDVTFAAPSDAAPLAPCRLKLTKTARGRPGSAFAAVGHKLVRGAIEIPSASRGAETLVRVTYA